MSGNEKIRAGVVQFFPDKRVITSGIASYMCHHHVYFFNFEMSDLRILQPKRLPVDVAIYGTKRFQGSQACRQCVRTDISSMPDLVTFREIFHVLVVPPGVGI